MTNFQEKDIFIDWKSSEFFLLFFQNSQASNSLKDRTNTLSWQKFFQNMLFPSKAVKSQN